MTRRKVILPYWIASKEDVSNKEALKKKKAVVVPGAMNKFICFFSKFFSMHFLAKTTGKIWKKSQAKRGF